jgi:hypothetical protein
MVDVQYVVSRLEDSERIELSGHAERRAKLRGIDPVRVVSVLEEGEVLGARPNDNPNVEIDYSETYLVLIRSQGSEFYYLPVYFKKDRALVTTVLKLSESNIQLLEW